MEEMDLIACMDMMEEELEISKKALFSPLKKVDTDRIYELLETMRANYPEEMRQAERILSDKQRIIEEARAESDRILRDAERRANELVDEHEIVQAATEKAKQVLASAQKNSREVRQGAKNYAEDLMRDIEGYLTEYTDMVRKNREALAGKN